MLCVAVAASACVEPQPGQETIDAGPVDDPTTPIEAPALCPSDPGPRCAATEPIQPFDCTGFEVKPGRSLLIRNPSVVDDRRARWSGAPPLAGSADGVWSFGRLITEMAGGHDASLWVEAWIRDLWAADQRIIVEGGGQGRLTPGRRELLTVLAAWPRDAAGRLNLAAAPFRLLAIVPRLDLRLPDGNYPRQPHRRWVPSAGELHFVYGLIGTDGTPRPLTVILEYAMPTCSSVGAWTPSRWARRFYLLGQHDPTTEIYKEELQKLTERVTRGAILRDQSFGLYDRMANGVCRPYIVPNGSAFLQIRTHDRLFTADGELREFYLVQGRRTLANDPLRGAPTGSPLEGTVAEELNGTAALAEYVNANSAAILDDRTDGGDHVAALFQPSTGPAVLLQSMHSRGSGTGYTEVPCVGAGVGCVSSTLRHAFSKRQCVGCHGRETGTSGGFHIAPRAAGARSEISPFLSGTTVADPVTGELRRLGELERRAADMRRLICGS